MRGEDRQQNHMFSYMSPEARVRKDHPLRAIRAMVDEDMELKDELSPSVIRKAGVDNYLYVLMPMRL